MRRLNFFDRHVVKQDGSDVHPGVQKLNVHSACGTSDSLWLGEAQGEIRRLDGQGRLSVPAKVFEQKLLGLCVRSSRIFGTAGLRGSHQARLGTPFVPAVWVCKPLIHWAWTNGPMDAGSEIDWSVLDNPLADLEAAEDFSGGVEVEPEATVNEDEVVEEEEAVDMSFEACQKYFEIQIDEIELLELPTAWVAELQDLWQKFLQRVGGRQSAGEIIYDAVLEAAPRVIIDDFNSPRTVWSSRFVDGLSALIAEVADAKILRSRAEAMGFSHLSLAVTFSKCELFRDVIVSVIEQELGVAQFPPQCAARQGFNIILNYISGALLYTNDIFATRVKAIQKSWRQANKKVDQTELADEEKSEVGETSGKLKAEDVAKETFQNFSKAAKRRRKGLNVPKTFNEMFLFNSCVMGYEDSEWMDLILDQFDAIASNVDHLDRLQEECDVLSMVLTKYLQKITYSEFKVVLLATLRSLVKDWNSDMDVAWNWFWDRLEHMLMDRKTLLNYQKKLQTTYTSVDETTFQLLRKTLFASFFESVPAAQEYLKTSMTRLYFVADRIFEMTLEMFENPRKMIQDITSVGLMHVGMNIPREFFKPFAVAAMQTFEEVIKQDVACLGFSWSISLIGRVMERVIAEGSTVVMKAICLNQETQLAQAMAVAPRAERAQHLLVVSAGQMSTSPLYWSIDSGHLGCARIIIEDLLTIRADRDNYYYGCDTLFHVHPDLIHHLCNNAPSLLGPLLDGLVWKSRSTHNGLRRVNYFIKNLLQDKDGNFSKSIEWLVNYDDPKAISHPASALAVNVVWSGLAVRYFLAGRVFFLISLSAFMAGQAVYVHHDGSESYVDNIVVASCRAFTYFLSMTSLLYDHIKHLYVDCSMGNVVHRCYVPIPLYLCNSRQLCSLILNCTLVLMATLEPILWCLGEFSNPNSPFEIFTSNCPTGDLKNIYSVCASLASLLYWFLLTDLAVFSMRLYALLLVCQVVAMELLLFLASALFLVLSFSTALNALDHSIEDFEGVPRWAKSLGQIVMNMVPTSFYYGFQSSATVFLIMSLLLGCDSVTASLWLGSVAASQRQQRRSVAPAGQRRSANSVPASLGGRQRRSAAAPQRQQRRSVTGRATASQRRSVAASQRRSVEAANSVAASLGGRQRRSAAASQRRSVEALKRRSVAPSRRWSVAAFTAPSQRRSVAASQRRSVEASQRRTVAALERRSVHGPIAASQRRGVNRTLVASQRRSVAAPPAPKSAQTVLEKIYEGVSLVQARSTRQTVPGFAVMEMLKQCRKNAMRLGEEALEADKDSREAFEKLSGEIEEELSSTTKDIGKKSIVKANLESDVAEAKRKMGLTEDELESLAETKSALHKSCDFVVKNFEATQAARGAEIQVRSAQLPCSVGKGEEKRHGKPGNSRHGPSSS
eukprot:s1188_g13.t1